MLARSHIFRRAQLPVSSGEYLGVVREIDPRPQRRLRPGKRLLPRFGGELPGLEGLVRRRRRACHSGYLVTEFRELFVGQPKML